MFHSLIGQGYYGTITPPVIRRNILENPAWYSGYTPYQAEISQGRLEALFNFQTMVSDLTGLPIANASLLDEPTAVAEAIMLCHRANRSKGSEVFYPINVIHKQLLYVRHVLNCLGGQLLLEIGKATHPVKPVFAVVQYPETDGVLNDFSEFSQRMHENGVLVVAATDLLALTLLPSLPHGVLMLPWVARNALAVLWDLVVLMPHSLQQKKRTNV